MPQETVRIAHISDLHFAQLTFHPSQFLSKRWVGNFNLLLNRGRRFSIRPLLELAALFHELKVEQVIVSGDLTTTSLRQEFEAATGFLETLRAAGMEVYLIPGNHDNYTKEAYRTKFFYDCFRPIIERTVAPDSEFTLEREGVAAAPLGCNWWWVGIDTTLATPMMSSRGLFTDALARNLDDLMRQIPHTADIVMVNHFPLFPTPYPRHNMDRSEVLRALLVQWPNVRLYLHGHVHHQSITDQRPVGLPIILNSGSCGEKGNATCHVIELHSHSCDVQVYRFAREPGAWDLRRKSTFDWEHH